MASLANPAVTGELILELFVKHLTALKVRLPARQYRAPGQVIVWDGEQLTVALMGVEQGQPGGAFGGTFSPRAATYHVTYSVNLVRKIVALETDGPFGAMIPADDIMDADGQASMADAGALIQAAQAIHQAYELTSPGEGFVVGPLQTIGPEGGLAGTRLLLTLSAD